MDVCLCLLARPGELCCPASRPMAPGRGSGPPHHPSNPELDKRKWTEGRTLFPLGLLHTALVCHASAWRARYEGKEAQTSTLALVSWGTYL